MFFQNFNNNLIFNNETHLNNQFDKSFDQVFTVTTSNNFLHFPIQTTTTLCSTESCDVALKSSECSQTMELFNNLKCQNENIFLDSLTLNNEQKKDNLHLSSDKSINKIDMPSNAEFSTKLRPDQIECLCKVLENSSSIDKLENFLSNFSNEFNIESNFCEYFTQNNNNNLYELNSVESCRQQMLRAKSIVLFHAQKFDELYEFIEMNKFADENHSFLQRLWNEAHYAEAELQRGKKLDPVSRYRVRKKNVFPRSIWDGEGTSYCFKKSARAILKVAYQKHNTPNQQQKQELALKTNLSVVQVSNWFKNQRQRARQYMRGSRGIGTASCSGYSSDDADGVDSEHDDIKEDEEDENNNNKNKNDNSTTPMRSNNDFNFLNYDARQAKRRKIDYSTKFNCLDEKDANFPINNYAFQPSSNINTINFESYDSLMSSDQNLFYPTNEENAKTMAMYAAAAAAQMYYGAQQPSNEIQQHQQQFQQHSYYPYYLNADSNNEESNILPQFRLFAPLQTELNLNSKNVEENSATNSDNNNIDLQLKYALL